MKKYAVYGSGKPEPTPFEYEIGEIIIVDSHKRMRCKKKVERNGVLIQYFSQGRIVFD
ncbi:hypothetical protein CPT_Mater187 [Bacillus phage Mater]|uniref:Uncharacterized protein n=1 Tax=Bacillus phage Mater TaxID=1540090 RepID=A0A0A0RNY0_9CAUD|nr:hypothetical protein CPT_Mater187 [Bacillus phage Mater]AIW03344.1 hypothetical protein CPT_Mater187 [Bacillus phage Mater]